MPSDLTQILSAASGSLLAQQPTTANTQQNARANHVPLPQQIAQITQIASAETATKVAKNDKERGVQVPKKAEANFAGDKKHENDHSQEESTQSEGLPTKDSKRLIAKA